MGRWRGKVKRRGGDGEVEGEGSERWRRGGRERH